MRCSAQASCDELRASIDEFRPQVSPALSQCWSLCRDTFTCADDGRAIDARWQCDGDRDCVDGSDERGCQYFECAQSGLVSASARCDEWPDCYDESDEESCP